MKVYIYRNLTDSILEKKWKEFEKANDLFPQQKYCWHFAWNSFYNGNSPVYVITVEENSKILAIAPMRISREYGIRTIRSIPYSMSDRYQICVAENEDTGFMLDLILTEIESMKEWDWVRIDKVYRSDPLFDLLLERKFLNRMISGSVSTIFPEVENWNGFIATLSRNFRRKIKKNINRSERNHQVDFRFLSRAELQESIDDLFAVHVTRWTHSRKPSRTMAEYSCWKEAILAMNTSVGFVLSFDGRIAAYRIGFIHQGFYYDWNTGFLPEYVDESVGFSSMVRTVRWLIDNGNKGINFLAGVYPWKLEWSDPSMVNEIHTFTSNRRTLASMYANIVFHHTQPRLKALYIYFMRWEFLRYISRIFYRMKGRNG